MQNIEKAFDCKISSAYKNYQTINIGLYRIGHLKPRELNENYLNI